MNDSIWVAYGKEHTELILTEEDARIHQEQFDCTIVEYKPAHRVKALEIKLAAYKRTTGHALTSDESESERMPMWANYDEESNKWN